MRAESFGDVRAISPKGAIGLMQIMPETWAALRQRYRLGADPYDAHDNIIAGAAYLRELHDRYGIPGFLAAYNAGPARWEDHLATGRPLPAETRAYLSRLAPIVGGSAADDTVILAAVVKSWTEASLFPTRPSSPPSDTPSAPTAAIASALDRASCAGLDGARAAVRWAVRRSVEPGAAAMSAIGGHHAVEGCGGGLRVRDRAAQEPNQRTAREKAGLRRGACGWED